MGNPSCPGFQTSSDISARSRISVGIRPTRCGQRGNGSAILTSNGYLESPALATRIVDRIGAGDALFAITSPCAFRGAAPEVLGFIGNCVGGLAVEIVCNREPIKPVALFKFIQTLLK